MKCNDFAVYHLNSDAACFEKEKPGYVAKFVRDNPSICNDCIYKDKLPPMKNEEEKPASEIKENTEPADYKKAMLYHSDRADQYAGELSALREQVEKLKLGYDNENYHLRTAKKIQEQIYNENVALSEQNSKLVEALEAIKNLPMGKAYEIAKTTLASISSAKQPK